MYLYTVPDSLVSSGSVGDIGTRRCIKSFEIKTVILKTKIFLRRRYIFDDWKEVLD